MDIITRNIFLLLFFISLIQGTYDYINFSVRIHIFYMFIHFFCLLYQMKNWKFIYYIEKMYSKKKMFQLEIFLGRENFQIHFCIRCHPCYEKKDRFLAVSFEIYIFVWQQKMLQLSTMNKFSENGFDSLSKGVFMFGW